VNASEFLAPPITDPWHRDAVQGLVPACLQVYGARLRAVVLFGSVARGTARPDSDVDVLVVADGLPAGRLRRMEEFAAVEAALAAGADLSPVLRTPAEVDRGSWLFLDMTRDAVLLFDPDGWMAGRLGRVAAKLRAAGARRRPYKGSWVWELPPDPELLRP
jgi:predicted nucleotidyltransferase